MNSAAMGFVKNNILATQGVAKSMDLNDMRLGIIADSAAIALLRNYFLAEP